MVAVVLLIAFGLCAFGFFGFAILGRVDKERRKAEANADEILDATFDGSPVVTFQFNLGTLKYADVVAAAIARGYRVESQDSNTYGVTSAVFTKANGED